jgi:hypothetical protein
VKYRLFSANLKLIWIFLTVFRKIFKLNFTKIHPVGYELFHVDRRTNGRTWRNYPSFFAILRTRQKTDIKPVQTIWAGQGPVADLAGLAGSCEHCINCCINCYPISGTRFLDQLNDYKLLKNKSGRCVYLINYVATVTQFWWWDLGWRRDREVKRSHGFIAPRPLYTGPLCPTME